MKIDVRSDESVCIIINDWTYYIDDSTGKQIITIWETNNPDNTFTIDKSRIVDHTWMKQQLKKEIVIIMRN